MFRSFLQAGLECARLEWQGNLCLLTGTGHLPEQRMRAHHGIALDHGIRTVRDGLPPWLPIEPRLRLARNMGMEVICDLNHHGRHCDPEGYGD